MLSLKQATKKAEALTELLGEPHLVFQCPANSLSQQAPGNLYNTGKYEVCSESEKEDYLSGGAMFVGDL